MKFIGIILLVAGIAGAALTFMNIVNVAGPMGVPGTWGIVAGIGAVVFFLFRRPSD